VPAGIVTRVVLDVTEFSADCTSERLQLAALIVVLDAARADVLIIKSSNSRSEVEKMRFIRANSFISKNLP
jgi:hypothetical protein